MAKKKSCAKKCGKKCAPKKSTKKPKVETFDNRLSSVETITSSNETPGFFTRAYRYLFPMR